MTSTPLATGVRVPAEALTLGILAGGRATRLGGIDKAWLQRDGISQVARWSRRFVGEHGPVLVSANRDPERYAAHGLIALPDRMAGLGPLGGIESLAAACPTTWLFTLPVDVVGVNDCLLRSLVAGRGDDGAFAVDDDGAQPLVALWRCERLREACASALAESQYAIRSLQARMTLRPVTFCGFRFGNLNTPADLLAAGFPAPSPP